jgi:hypothetical protein
VLVLYLLTILDVFLTAPPCPTCQCKKCPKPPDRMTQALSRFQPKQKPPELADFIVLIVSNLDGKGNHF